MADYPRFDYTPDDIRDAGKVIAREMLWTPENESAIRQAFNVANSWRDSHAFPMLSIRLSALYHLRGTSRISAARLKRMQAVRGKLRRLTWLNFDEMQDLGGCRIILPTIADVQGLSITLKKVFRHELAKEDDYILKPKKSGYRSHHLIWRYAGRRRNKVFDGRSIELQVRTSLEHSWATTIEAVGLYRGEPLKNFQGSDEWLRFFTLMSADFAASEACAVPDGTPDTYARHREIRELAKELDAISILETVSNAFQGSDIPLDQGYKPSHFLIRYNRATRKVSVTPYNIRSKATHSYDLAEAPSNKSESDNESIVLVEVGKIESLRDAYPNYFGDVERFKENLKEIVQGAAAISFARTQREPRKPFEPVTGDPRWLSGARFPKPDAVPSKTKKRN
jgi:hypothetical protein